MPYPFRRVIERAVLVASLLCATARAETSAQVDARKHFLQGVALVDERRLSEALAEFEQSYALYPAYGTLYNLAQVHAALGHPLAAVEAFEKYLTDGGALIPANRRARVEGELAAQRAMLGELTIQIRPAEAALRIDDQPVAHTGSTLTQRVTAGHHRVSATLADHRGQRRDIEVRAQEQVAVELTLEAESDLSAPVVAPAAAPARSPVGELPRDQRSTQRVAGYVVGGLGLAGVGAGIAIAVAGQTKHNDALDQWYAGDKDAARETESASANQKTVGYVVLGVGGAATVVSAILLLTARTPPATSTATNAATSTGFSYSPWLMPSLVGASLQKRW